MREHQYQVHEDYKEVHQDHKEHQDHNYQQNHQDPEDNQDYEAHLEAGEGWMCFLGEPGAGTCCHVPGFNMVNPDVDISDGVDEREHQYSTGLCAMYGAL